MFWPDGHVAEGVEAHIEDLKKLFVHSPDTRIKEHPIKFGTANYTLVTGVFEGTFTKPMPIGNGKFIQRRQGFQNADGHRRYMEKWSNGRGTSFLG